jgi:hypothetical protein
MMSRYLRRFGGLILSVLLLPGFVALLADKSAEAQQRRVIIVPVYRPYHNSWWGYRHWGYDPYFDYYSRYGHYVFDNTGQAYSQGYRDGQKTGAGDLKNHRTYNPQRSHYFQEAGFGNFGEHYRSGFVRGYADAFRV